MRIASGAALAAALGLALTGTAQARSRADLVESRLGNPPARLSARRSFTVTDMATNRGPARSRRSLTRYYLRSGRTSLLAGTRRVPALAHAGRSRGRVRLKVRSGAPGGRYSVVACVDARHQVKEGNERNNCRVARRRLAVSGPHGAASGAVPTGSSADSDHDGFPDSVDCAPHDGSVNPGERDLPDLGFVDSDCDGIDGDAARAVFVSPNGNDASAGTMGAPLRTLAAAVARADSHDRDVYAAAGTYVEELRVASRVGVYGGYTPSWRRSRSSATVIAGTITASGDSEGALALNITAQTTLQLLTLAPRTPTAPGTSSYGLRGMHSAGLRIDHLTVAAATGAVGAAGANGMPGAAGSAGGDADQISGGGSVGRGGSSPVNHPGGRGGYPNPNDFGDQGEPGQSTNADAFGRKGGAGGDSGLKGSHHTTGGGGVGGDPGKFLGDGHGGASGNAAVGSGRWQGRDGIDGVPGSDGHGGGGGGGGGADDCTLCAGSYGGGGGGGGGGGQGGAGGHAGQHGGGSFGILLVDSLGAVVRDSAVTAADGAAGGAGGAGALGGPGGLGGLGGIPNDDDDASPGGRGGIGGAGGLGGNGGGGAGGPSAAIVGLTPAAVIGTTLHHGAGGVGGGGDLSAGVGRVGDFLLDAP
jgi:hypothetical protein